MPTGSHGAFRDYQIDAITMEISPKISLNREIGHSAFLLKGGRSVSTYHFCDNFTLVMHVILSWMRRKGGEDGGGDNCTKSND